jgi:hypothetical protein
MTEPQPYDNGGLLQPGATLTTNTTGEPEPVIALGQQDGDEP